MIRGVSVTIANRSDRYPVGTEVGAYPRRAKQFGSAPSGEAVETHTVGADGKLGPYTTLTADTPYVLYAAPGGVNRYLDIEDSTQPAESTLQERLATAHAAVEA